MQKMRPTLFFIAMAFFLDAYFLDAKGWSQVPQQSVVIDNIRFRVPANMTLTKVAADPLIRWPVSADWNDDGDLVVVECHWDGTSVEDQLESKPHKLVRLSDDDGDGIFDRRTVVADRLSFCEGVLVEGNQAWITTPPTIQKLTDVDGDGFFERHEVWHDGGTLTYCANDLHGPMRGPDGWLYWTKGAFAEQETTSADGSKRNSKASHIYRQHPDGRPPEIVVTAGMDNPADIAFLPNGDLLFCGTFFHHPSSGKRDGIAHGIYGSVFGKDHNVLKDHFKTGPLMNPIAELGPAAPAALYVLQGKQRVFGSQHFPNIDADESIVLSAQFNLQSIGIHHLRPNDGTYRSEDAVLLSGDRVDFHPVDILPDEDGSLLIFDTGGWYDLCCPSSGVDDQVAPGGIYRLQFREASKSAAQTDDSELAEIWTRIRNLTQAEPQSADWQAIAEALESESEQVACAAAHAMSLYRRQELLDLLEVRIRNSTATPALRRRFFEAIGRMPRSHWRSGTDYLFDSLESYSTIRSLEHAALISLNELATDTELQSRLRFGKPAERWAALKILNYRQAFRTTDWQPLVEILFDHCPDEELVMQIFADQPEIGAMLVPQLRSFLALQLKAPEGARPDSKTMLWAKLVGTCRSIYKVQMEVGSLLEQAAEFAPEHHVLLANIISNCRGETLPDNWVWGVEHWLRSANFPDVKQTLIPVLQDLRWQLPRDQGILDELVSQLNCYPEDTDFQLQVISCLPDSLPGDQREAISTKVRLAVLRIVIGEDRESALQASKLISKLGLNVESAERLLAALPQLPPQEFRFVTRALLQMNEPEIDTRLREMLTDVSTFATLPRGELTSWISGRDKAAQETWRQALNSLYEAPSDVKETVERWLADLPEGDTVEGYNVFRSAKATCSSCHQVAYVGGQLGPNLSKIGHTRSPRDLLEAILFPSRRIEHSYQATRVLTVDGKVFNGKVLAENEDYVELQCNADEKCRIPADDIAQRSASSISLMPQGLEKSLSKQEMADLLAFLMSRR